MFGCTPTKTANTKHMYERIAGRLIARFLRSVQEGSRRTQAGFFEWLVKQKPLLAPSTWRQYKAAVIWYCERHDHRELRGLLKRCDNRGCKQEPRRLPAAERKTSAKKQKSISEADFARILKAYLAIKNPPYWLRMGIRLFFAIYYTGLRPCEFPTARLLLRADDNGQRGIYVRVCNAKNTNGRTHGKYRHVAIGQYDLHIQRMIGDLLKLARSPWDAKGKPIGKERFIRNASQAFSVFTHKLFPRRHRSITLYSARHQFCADLKKAGMTRAQVAAVMGHGNDLTSVIHYGKRRSGIHRPDTPLPLNEEVSRVKVVAKASPFAAAAPQAVATRSAPAALGPLAQKQNPRGPAPGVV